MKRIASLILLLCMVVAGAQLRANHRKLPPATASSTFVLNKGQLIDTDGQLRPDVLARASIAGTEVYLRKTGLSYVFLHTPEPHEACSSDDDAYEDFLDQQVETYRMDMELVGAHPNPPIEYDFISAHHSNFFYAHCPDGITKVPGYRQVTYKDIYPGIDWVVYLQEGNLKYDFVVHPGGDPADIVWRYVGAEQVTAEAGGTIAVDAPIGRIQEGAVVAFQDQATVQGNYQVQGHHVRFSIGSYDTNRDLVIDPMTLIWSSYLGGSGLDTYGPGIAADPFGNVFMSGQVQSFNFPTTAGAFQLFHNGGSYDAYLTKWNATGNVLYSTYYGGSDSESCSYRRGIICDPSGNVWMSGVTRSSNLPVTASAHQFTYGGGGDAYLVKWSNAGARLYATYYQGPGLIASGGIEVVADASGNAYLVGFTLASAGITTPGAAQTVFGGAQDLFIAKFNSAGVRQWGTYYGGAGSERSFTPSAVVDLSGNLWVSGMTSGTVPVTAGAHQTTSGGSTDAFLAKYSTNGTLLYSTMYGGSGNENLATGVTVDGFNNIWMMGTTNSTNNIVTAGAHQSTIAGNNDIYLVKWNNAGVRQYATYWGGSLAEETWGVICADAGNNIWVGTSTFSTDLPLLNPVQSVHGGGASDWAVAQFSNSGVLLNGTYWGGTGYNDMDDAVIDPNGGLWLAGVTSLGYPTTAGVFQPVYGGAGRDNAIAKFNTNVILDHETVLSIASRDEQAVGLSWETSRSGLFEVQRSIDLAQGEFRTIGTTVAATYSDLDPAYNTDLYYRLKYRDADQRIHYSNIVQARLSSAARMSLVPNPAAASGEVHVFYEAEPGQNVTVTLKNSFGQAIRHQTDRVSSGSASLRLQTQGLAAGVYFVSLRTADRVLTEKLVLR